ncbi:nuclear transport factor 2 family protein [Streptomyces sp. NPDC101227]|uniref:nuclear transport factor 2 family protein n=1 Tax=Streptomyces sp. NPDC101227 TaxID=3366136 RepID=UPI00380A59FD
MNTDRPDPVHEAKVAKVREYYRLVDATDVPGLIALFTEDAVYRRPGYAPMRGHRGLRAFYTGERVIESGRHTVTSVVVQGERSAVTGVFEGVLKDGSEVSLEFADFFLHDDADQRFRRRDTYFFAPLV